MKNTQTANIGGLAFTIDEDAYEMLSHYLSAIEKHYFNEAERKEIMEDIEARIAEILRSKGKDLKQVVTIQDIEDVISVMGKPEDFRYEQKDNSSQWSKTESAKRVYRDPDNRILGGVCGGLAVYCGIEPLLMRIVFLIAFFGFGVGLIIYIILWIVIPEAKTTAQKLEMKGEPVNFSNIGDFVKQEYEHVKNNVKRGFTKKNA